MEQMRNFQKIYDASAVTSSKNSNFGVCLWMHWCIPRRWQNMCMYFSFAWKCTNFSSVASILSTGICSSRASWSQKWVTWLQTIMRKSSFVLNLYGGNGFYYLLLSPPPNHASCYSSSNLLIVPYHMIIIYLPCFLLLFSLIFSCITWI